MNLRAYCRIPKNAQKRVMAKEGSCPELLYDLLNELEGAKEIYIATYLFNNPVYYDFLEGLAKNGCKVKITSLPILGYSNKLKIVEGYGGKISGRQMAEEIYNRINSTGNMELRVFPHLYKWYGALYANGGASYSFHVKVVQAWFPDNKVKSIISSGNFMFTDPYHSDNILILENGDSYNNVFTRFFQDLEKFSIPYCDFLINFTSLKDEFLYSFTGKEINLSGEKYHNCFFTAPFYLYNSVGSNHYAGMRIVDLINNAKKRVWVCAQHFHDVVSFDPGRGKTMVKALYVKNLINPKVEFKFLKQVPHSSLADKRRAAITETIFKFVMNADQRYNRLAHDKFIIIDDTLLVSTANYTSTQFAYGNIEMNYIEDKEKYKKIDNFSEVNGFVIIPSCPKDVLGIYERHFNELWDGGSEIKLEI